MSAFKALKSLVSDHATKISPESLQRGVKYEVYCFKNRRSDYPDRDNKYPDNLVAYFRINNLKYYTTLPAIYNNQTQSVLDELNAPIKDNKAPFIVYYGKDGKRNHILIHEHGEAIDQELLSEFDAKMKKQEEPSTSKSPQAKRQRSEWHHD